MLPKASPQYGARSLTAKLHAKSNQRREANKQQQGGKQTTGSELLRKKKSGHLNWRCIQPRCRPNHNAILMTNPVRERSRLSVVRDQIQQHYHSGPVSSHPEAVRCSHDERHLADSLVEFHHLWNTILGVISRGRSRRGSRNILWGVVHLPRPSTGLDVLRFVLLVRGEAVTRSRALYTQ